MSLPFTRRSMMRGLLGGAAICVGIPTLDQFLNGSGTAYGAGSTRRFKITAWTISGSVGRTADVHANETGLRCGYRYPRSR